MFKFVAAAALMALMTGSAGAEEPTVLCATSVNGQQAFAPCPSSLQSVSVSAGLFSPLPQGAVITGLPADPAQHEKATRG